MTKGEAKNILARVVGGATHPSYTDIREACRYALDVLNEPSIPSDVDDDLDEIDPKHLVHEKMEEPDKSLEEELDKWRHEHFHGKRDNHFSGEYLERTSQLDLARHFVEWGAEHLRDSTKMIDKSLEEAAEISFDEAKCLTEDYRDFLAKGLTENKPRPIGPHWFCEYAKNRFIVGAEWQARQLLQGSPMPEDTVLFNNGVAEGRRLEREDMLKEAEECNLYYDGDFLAIDLNMAELGYSEWDKVRIVVLKEEEE